MRRVFRRRVERTQDGVDVAAELHAVVAVNAGTAAQRTETRSHSSVHVVQGKPARGDQPEAHSEQGPPEEAP
jgi:hypothetical protein